MYRPRQLFMPVGAGESFDRRVIAPSRQLESIVAYYWSLSFSGGGPVACRVVPDACNDLVLDASGSLPLLAAGVTTAFVDIPMDPGASLFGVCFRPGAARRFFGFDPANLVGDMARAADVFDVPPSELEGRLADAPSDDARALAADAYFSARLRRGDFEPSDPRLERVLAAAYAARGRMRADDLEAGGLSPRHARRLFRGSIGIGPKAFLRVVRFQAALSALLRLPRSLWKDVHLDCGYYDQAHFLRDCRRFLGGPPSACL